ncbi:hypothetical protein TWF696_004627 [Orbilia brochopaga]|uniref:Prolactin receptor n=1 Tax=Orbilia brochopaga TaxID=3140254 RepID=A0AAV9VAJ9_9PEZI
MHTSTEQAPEASSLPALEAESSTQERLTLAKLSELDAHHQREHAHGPEDACSISHGSNPSTTGAACGMVHGSSLGPTLSRNNTAEDVNVTTQTVGQDPTIDMESKMTAKKHRATSYATDRYISSEQGENFWTPYGAGNGNRVQKRKHVKKIQLRYPAELTLSDSE